MHALELSTLQPLLSFILLTAVAPSNILGQTVTIVDEGGAAPQAIVMPNTSPKVSVADFNASNIIVVPYGPIEFFSLLETVVPRSIQPVIQPLLPYSILVRNGNVKPVMAYTVRWASVDSSGRQDVNTYTLVNLVSLLPVIPPGSASLATILGHVSDVTNPGITTEIAAAAQSFQNNTSLAISLDAVVFNDGTAIGNDTTDTLALVRGCLKAEYDLYTAVIRKIDAGTSDADMASWLQAIAAPAASLSPNLDAYSRKYQSFQSRFARHLIAILGDNGRSAALEYVRSVLLTKPYPRLIVE